MSTPEIREAAKDFVHTVEMAEMGEVAMRQMHALEAVTTILRDVAEREAGPEDTERGRGYIQGQQALSRRLLEAIVREVER